MLALLLIIGLQAGEIVVTGKRLEAAQQACVRGGCTPLRDAQASIALAEAQFRKGDYLIAKRTLAAAVARNRDHAANAPKPVAALYEAYATVAYHEGDRESFRRAVAGQVHTLRDNLPAGDPAVTAVAPALGDMWIKLGHYHQAEMSLRSAEADAIRAGQDRAAMLVALRRAWLIAAFDDRPRANRMLDELERRSIAQDAGLRTALRVVRFRINAASADDAQVASFAAALARDQGAPPVLLWSPRLPMGNIAATRAESRKFGGPDPLAPRSSDVAGLQWVDVGYWIRPDGHTDDVEILRGTRSADWGPAIVWQISGRRYMPLKAETAPAAGDAPGLYRIERVTRHSRYTFPGGSFIRRRVQEDGYEYLDLTRPSDQAGTSPMTGPVDAPEKTISRN